ncbi:unnamed protein product [Dracunculus medinensis]|uniref:ASD2 domain-containing protein n=1 Tax=Dracunculus medinensis TaxID=318479 RepID=A0A158Q4V0_DRAME|nr:unnamed protein product [Dracunculus medinensis]
MLHRTPSGAKKRIRQRQEQKWLKSISSTNSFDHSLSSTDNNSGDYRSLVNAGDYKSILPDELPFNSNQLQVTNLYSPALSPRQSSQFTSAATAVSTTTSNVSSVLSPVTAFLPSASSSSSCIGGKPTVEVHPMPSQQQQNINTKSAMCFSSKYDILSEKIREKPIVPKKPAKLILNSSIFDSSKTSPLSLSTSMLNLPTFSSQASSVSSNCNSSISRLFTTPSLICLHTALMQPSLTEEEIERLETKRQQLIESISRKISILDGEKDSIDNEIEANETLRRCIVNDLLNNCENQVLVEKIEKNLAQNSQLIRLETRLRMQLERLESLPSDSVEKDLNIARIEKIKQQIDDKELLLKAFNRRDSDVDRCICSLLCVERRLQWRFYKETWKKLMVERHEIDERLSFGREQLNALLKAQTNL